MPNVDAAAKAWELDLAARFGAAVCKRRKELGLTAMQLAEKTRSLGYPINRVAITKIERNLRQGKLDLAEVIILAAALDVAPLELLYPDEPDRMIEVLPGKTDTTLAASRWFVGDPDWLNPAVRDQLNMLARAITGSALSSVRDARRAEWGVNSEGNPK